MAKGYINSAEEYFKKFCFNKNINERDKFIRISEALM
jgi:hypothetical protein